MLYIADNKHRSSFHKGRSPENKFYGKPEMAHTSYAFQHDNSNIKCNNVKKIKSKIFDKKETKII